MEIHLVVANVFQSSSAELSMKQSIYKLNLLSWQNLQLEEPNF